MPVTELLAGILFVGSSGLFFSQKFRKNRFLIFCAGLIALVSTYFLTVEIVDRAVGAKLAEKEGATDVVRTPASSPGVQPTTASGPATVSAFAPSPDPNGNIAAASKPATVSAVAPPPETNGRIGGPADMKLDYSKCRTLREQGNPIDRKYCLGEDGHFHLVP